MQIVIPSLEAEEALKLRVRACTEHTYDVPMAALSETVVDLLLQAHATKVSLWPAWTPACRLNSYRASSAEDDQIRCHLHVGSRPASTKDGDVLKWMEGTVATVLQRLLKRHAEAQSKPIIVTETPKCSGWTWPLIVANVFSVIGMGLSIASSCVEAMWLWAWLFGTGVLCALIGLGIMSVVQWRRMRRS